MSVILKVNIWENIRRYYGEVTEWDGDVELGAPRNYKTVYTTEGNTYNEVMVNIALSLIRNSKEEIKR